LSEKYEIDRVKNGAVELGNFCSVFNLNATEAGEDATGVDFKLPHGADFRSCLLGITPELMK
jgi:hypothetical protein